MNAPLSPEERERLEELFERAAELPAAEHAAFLERECPGDSALRHELAHLLGGLAAEDQLTRVQYGAPLRRGTRIGPYKVLEKIGEGGMGEVYSAEQVAPVVRRVALKVIKLGMDTREVVARFEAERQALARMSHPNIAQVYDGGVTEDGRPYFVMEYVAGEPIGEYCDRRKLATRERLELLLDVCEGIQHAHQKGIIHRDLKPSNLLVMQQDGRALPKIIDFGVARATTGRLAECTLQTLVGQVVGTLAYMSPEQADPTGIDIDTRSDIYSLGVLLYQLVSGFLPLDPSSSADLPLSEIQRAIRETDPPTPSTQLRREPGTATSIAPLHGTDPRSLARQLEGDLDWICLKALEKDPARRYASASELAADVRRHLTHQPVLAGRPGALYRARKFVRRNRLAVSAGLLVVAGLVAGAVGILSGRAAAEARAEEAREAQQLALQNERLARAEMAKVLRLSDIKVAQELLARAHELWPPHPERIPDLEGWLESASELMLNRATHLETLQAMRAQALPWSPAERRRDLETHPLAGDLADKRAEFEDRLEELDGILDGAAQLATEQRLAELEAELETLATAVEQRRTWRFELSSQQWWHDVLTEMLALLDGIEADLLDEQAVSREQGWSISRRLASARELEGSFAEGGSMRQVWREALPDIRAAYPGLELRPQVGLVPIGADPASGLWEFAHLLSGLPAERDAQGHLIITERTGVVLVLLPGGSFLMGAQASDPGGPNYDPHADEFMEAPVHEVSLDPFFLSKFELTRAQWWRSTHANPSDDMLAGTLALSTLPVDGVSWFDCDELARRLGLTLPHEEQWEYAARAGSDTVWSTGDDEASLQGHANLFDQTGLRKRPRWLRISEGVSIIDDTFANVAPVGSLLPNAFGLHDMHGNHGEWCANSPYRYDPPASPPASLANFKTARGGNARYDAMIARSASRFDSEPNFKYFCLGVRLARPLE